MLLKGDLSCKMHLCTSCLHEYVSPVFQGTHQVSENTTLSIFLHTQISKKGAATDLIKTDPDLNTVLTSGRWRYGYWANSPPIRGMWGWATAGHCRSKALESATKAAKKTSRAWLPWLPFCLFSAVAFFLPPRGKRLLPLL